MLTLGVAAIDFSGVTLPFNATDLLTSSMGILGLLASFVLLGLAFAFVPKIMSAIRAAAASKSKSN